MSQDVYVVLDHGDGRDARTTVRGVYRNKADADARKEDVGGPFKWVTVEYSTIQEGIESIK